MTLPSLNDLNVRFRASNAFLSLTFQGHTQRYEHFTVADGTFVSKGKPLPSLVVTGHEVNNNTNQITLTFVEAPITKIIAGQYKFTRTGLSDDAGVLKISAFGTNSITILGHHQLDKAPADRSDECTIILTTRED